MFPGCRFRSPSAASTSATTTPTAKDGRVFASWTELESWLRARGKLRPGAPRVAVGFYRAAYYGGDTDVVDAVIAEIERRGANAVPLFGYPGHVAFERLLLDEQGRARVDVALAFLFRFAQPDSAIGLARVDVPILNLATLYGAAKSQWRASSTGLSLFEGTFQIAAPEFAGLLAPTVVGSRERIDDPSTGLDVIVNHPIAERVEMASLAPCAMPRCARRRTPTSAWRSSTTTTRRARPTSAPAISTLPNRLPTF